MTGGVGMGKTTSAAILSKLGVSLIDTDEIARDVVAPGMPALSELAALFGREVLDDAGRLRRDVVARRVFANPAERLSLEAILHPRIRAVWTSQAERWRTEGVSLGAVVIPLLFETGCEAMFDAVVCVACSRSSQQKRLRARGWDDVQIEQRIAAQHPTESKMARAGFVVWTEGEVSVHEEQWRRIIATIP